MNQSIERDPRTYAVIGAAMEVHRELGCGFLEGVYQEALAAEFALRSIPFVAQVPLQVHYKGQLLTTGYRADFFCFQEILVEIKALKSLSGVEEAQLLNYLKATRHEIGLLLNFGASSLETKRLVRSAHWLPKRASDSPDLRSGSRSAVCVESFSESR
ncbi:MAG: GxxExxY protein [Pirellulales bacterium]